MKKANQLIKQLQAFQNEVDDAQVKQALETVINLLKTELQTSEEEEEENNSPPSMNNKKIARETLKVIGDFFKRLGYGLLSKVIIDEIKDHL